MKLTPEEKETCKKHSKRDATGHVHCHDCPLVVDKRYSLCKSNMTKKEYKEWTDYMH